MGLLFVYVLHGGSGGIGGWSPGGNQQVVQFPKLSVAGHSSQACVGNGDVNGKKIEVHLF